MYAAQYYITQVITLSNRSAEWQVGTARITFQILFSYTRIQYNACFLSVVSNTRRLFQSAYANIQAQAPSLTRMARNASVRACARIAGAPDFSGPLGRAPGPRATARAVRPRRLAAMRGVWAGRGRVHSFNRSHSFNWFSD